MGNPRESQGILRNAGKSWEIQAKLREPSGITETALPVSMYSQVHAEARFDCYLQYFRRVQPNKGDTCLGGLFGGPLASLGGPRGSFGTPLGCLGTPLGFLGCPLGVLLVSLGVLGGAFGHPLGFLRGPLEPPGVSRGGLLVSWSVVGSSWRPLGLSWGPFGGIMGEGILEIQGCPKES